MTGTVINRKKASWFGVLLALATMFAVLVSVQAAWATVTITQVQNQTVNENQPLTFQVTATTDTNKNIIFNLGNGPTGASLTPGQQGKSRTATFNWTPTYTQAGNYPNVRITASEAGGGSSTQTIFAITVGNTNRPPVLDPIPDQTINEGQTLTFGISGSDPDGDALTFSASSLPTGASFSGNTFSWTPTYLQAGTYKVLFKVTDNGITAGNPDPQSAQQWVTITVGNVNHPPTFSTIGSQTADAGKLLSFTVTATDPDTDDTLTYSASNMPPGASFDPTTQTFSWTPGYEQAGNYTVTFTVSDGHVNVTQDVTITVNANRPPALADIGDQQAWEGQLLSFVVSGSDPDGGPLAYTTGSLPQGAQFDPATRTFTWTPDWGQKGTYSVQFTVTDSGTPPLSDSKTITITVGHTNRPPVLNHIGAKSINESETLSFTVSATDPDLDPLTFSAGPIPKGANFDPATGVFNWVPGYADSGNYDVTFTVTDGSLTASEKVTITVNNVNRPPTLTKIGDQSVNEGETLTFTLSASDPDGDNLIYSASNLPKGADFNPATKTFTWTPDFTQANSYPGVIFSVTDGAASASETITITVANVNRPPKFDAIPDQQVDEAKTLTFVVTATDQDNDPLTFSASNLPGGAAFDSATRTFSWTPTYDQGGFNYPATFNVNDGNGCSDSKTITITVNNVNRPPSLDSIGNKTVLEHQLLQFTVTGSDPDNDPITFSASDPLPAGATFDSATRTFTWTPDYNQAGNYSVTFFVTDTGGLVKLETITITVGNVNRAPSFTAIGQQSVKEGQTLTFTVSATDQDGDAITYSCGTLPKGAAFDPVTRSFSWTPAYGTAGNYTATFYATDNGTTNGSSDPKSCDTSVFIAVGKPTPSALINDIIKYILNLHLAKDVENSYIANLKKVDGFVTSGQKIPAVNQLNAFIQKVNQDLKKGGLINPADANLLIQWTNELIGVINS